MRELSAVSVNPHGLRKFNHLVSNLRAVNQPLRSLVLLLLIAFAGSWAAWAQVQNGKFIGVIRDPSGANVPNAQIVVNNVNTAYQVVVFSNDIGIYAAEELLVGTYRLTVQAAGFKAASTKDIDLHAGTAVRVDFN